MQKFLSQFKLSPMMTMLLEAHIFNVASRKVKGYNGGVWESKTLGKVEILLIPGEGDVTMSAAYSDVTTDRLTASAGFSSLVANWFWHSYAESMTKAQNAAFEKHYNAMRRLGTQHGLNMDDYFTLTD